MYYQVSVSTVIAITIFIVIITISNSQLSGFLPHVPTLHQSLPSLVVVVFESTSMYV